MNGFVPPQQFAGWQNRHWAHVAFIWDESNSRKGVCSHGKIWVHKSGSVAANGVPIPISELQQARCQPSGLVRLADTIPGQAITSRAAPTAASVASIATTKQGIVGLGLCKLAGEMAFREKP
jgi:hypothetical protein